MSHDRLTAGALRVLAELDRQIEQEPTATGWFQSLLLALIEDEGRAAELLKAAAIRPDQLHPVPSPHRHAPPVADETRSQPPRGGAVEWRRTLVRKAEWFAINTSEDAVTGSEHLLMAAIELDEVTAALLAERGVTLDSVLKETAVEEPHLAVPEEAGIRIAPAGQGAIDESSLCRILDASANRCREGLRVVEDFVRFHLEDRFLSGRLKELRHQLAYVLTRLGQPEWLAARDTRHDVGTRSSVASEQFRGTLVDVLRASLKRVEEALRSLEEYGKLIDSELSERLEQCRYRFYTVEKGIETSIQARVRLKECRLYLLVTDELSRYGAERLIRNVATAGVDVVQVREKGLSDRRLVEFCKRARDWTQAAGVLLIINDRPDVAALVGAEGVHLGQDDLAVHEARKILGANKLIGVSTHSIDQAREAVLAGADYLGVGPVFPSRTKDFSEVAGLDYVRRVSREISLPWFAIGGVDLENLSQVQAAGAARVAVSSAICQAPHPRGVAAEFEKRLRGAGVPTGDED